MFRLVVVHVLCLLATVVAADDKKDVPKELVPFQGTWKLVKAETGAEVPKEEDPTKVRLTFTGNKVTMKTASGVADAGSFAVDATREPTEITFTTPLGDKRPGIFKFDKDGKLTVCFAPGERNRPTKFDGKTTPKTVLLVLEKTKE